MRISDMSWSDVEDYLKRDDRAVLPLGSTEQHANLSLCVDHILSERVSVEAAEPLEVPVFPGIPYGMTPYFMSFPGTVSLSPKTYGNLLCDILESLDQHGFRRIVLVNGHGGNAPIHSEVRNWQKFHPSTQVKFHNWWNSAATWNAVQAIDPIASHASWMENFPWTRLPHKKYATIRKPPVDIAQLRTKTPQGVRDLIGDGNFGGCYQRSDEDMAAIWEAGVSETREVIQQGWLTENDSRN